MVVLSPIFWRNWIGWKSENANVSLSKRGKRWKEREKEETRPFCPSQKPSSSIYNLSDSAFSLIKTQYRNKYLNILLSFKNHGTICFCWPLNVNFTSFKPKPHLIIRLFDSVGVSEHEIIVVFGQTLITAQQHSEVALQRKQTWLRSIYCNVGECKMKKSTKSSRRSADAHIEAMGKRGNRVIYENWRGIIQWQSGWTAGYIEHGYQISISNRLEVFIERDHVLKNQIDCNVHYLRDSWECFAFSLIQNVSEWTISKLFDWICVH